METELELKYMYRQLRKGFPRKKIYERLMFRRNGVLCKMDNLLPISPYVLSKYDECPVVRLDIEENMYGEEEYYIVINKID